MSLGPRAMKRGDPPGVEATEGAEGEVPAEVPQTLCRSWRAYAKSELTKLGAINTG